MFANIFKDWRGLIVDLVLLIDVAAAFTAIPNPIGPYQVNITTAGLVDDDRLDPFAPDARHRAIMLSLFYPVDAEYHACETLNYIPYMPSATAAFHDQQFSIYGIPNGTFESLELPVCNEPLWEDHQMGDFNSNFPVLIFSPALGTSRLLYNALLQSVSSKSYIVVSIDHPYDANVVEFPDGSLVFGVDISTEEQIESDIATRAQDIKFVLNQLSNTTIARKLIPGATEDLQIDSVGVFGHSLGGGTAPTALAYDARIVGGLDMDGSFFGHAISGIDKPVLLFGREDHNLSSDATWATFWSTWSGWRIELGLEQAQHYTFSDLPLLVKILGFTGQLPPEAEALIGSLDGSRALDIIVTYVSTFFDIVLRGADSTFLGDLGCGFPEVLYLDDASSTI